MKSVIMLVVLVMFAVPVLAETYVWEDEQGTVNFADDLGRVPKQFRKKVQRLDVEEPPPAAEEEATTREKSLGRSPALAVPVAVRPGGAVAVDKELVTAPDKESRAVYGGKELSVWASDYRTIKADLKGTERQLADYSSRLQDTSRMSRPDYLTLQKTIKMLQENIGRLAGKLVEFKAEAGKAGVPVDKLE